MKIKMQIDSAGAWIPVEGDRLHVVVGQKAAELGKLWKAYCWFMVQVKKKSFMLAFAKGGNMYYRTVIIASL